MTSEKPLTIEASDGCPLQATLYTTSNPRGAVFIFGAMGVSQNYYRALAHFLNHHDLAAITFDPRGMGKSLKGAISKVKTDILTWSRQDAEAVLSELIVRVPNVPVTWLGHSLGGQIMPLTPSHVKVAKFITVASGSGWWKENSPELRRRVWLLWYGFAPVLTPIFGYFPGEKLKMVGNLPKGVIQQWRRWCLHPQYIVGVEGEEMRDSFANFRAPITSLSFSDDEMMSEKNISSLHEFYTSAPKKMLRFSPRDLNRKRIGHFGFFRSEQKELWEKLLLPEIL
ncbi:MAG: alpha/beta fold hydrolase [Bacteriovoracaceae bacterium]